jgi:hypothetical protein
LRMRSFAGIDGTRTAACQAAPACFFRNPCMIDAQARCLSLRVSCLVAAEFDWRTADGEEN